jgi:tetratricopeptide (TPR) repeat protein
VTAARPGAGESRGRPRPLAPDPGLGAASAARVLVVAAALGASWLVAGCAYFNGMYNANHLARQAVQSERAGRIGEARDRWARAAVHAESLVARHPKSHWVDAALVVQGRALVHLGYYADAVPVLTRAVREASQPALRAEALVLLGEANLGIHRPTEARAALDSALLADRPAVRADALLYRARAFVALGMPGAARDDLRRSAHPHAPFELAGVDRALGDTAAAGALYDSLAVAMPYADADWRAQLDSLAVAGDAPHASDLVDRLAGRGDLTAGQKGRLLLDDAERHLAAGDTAAAAARWQRTRVAAADSTEGLMAAVRLSRLAIARATGDSVLAEEGRRLQDLARQGGAVAQEASATLALLSQAVTLAAADSTPDAYWFRRAEIMRDSLHAGQLAARAFADMAHRFPDSPWTPKALVAAIAAGAPDADSLRALLRGRFAGSPYALAASGSAAGADRFAALEDSLQHTLARLAPPGRERRAGEEEIGPTRARPGAPVRRPGDRPAGPVRPGAGPPRP